MATASFGAACYALIAYFGRGAERQIGTRCSAPVNALASGATSGHYTLVAPSSEEVSRAIVVWTGYDAGIELGKPDRDEARLVEAFGETAVFDLLPIVNRLEQDFYTSTAHNTVAGLSEMAEQAANEFKGRHPELSDDAVAALAWCYSLDWK